MATVTAVLMQTATVIAALTQIMQTVTAWLQTILKFNIKIQMLPPNLLIFRQRTLKQIVTVLQLYLKAVAAILCDDAHIQIHKNIK